MTSGTQPTAAVQPAPRRSLTESYRFRQALGLWAVRIALIVITLVSLFPTMYVVLYSLKGGGNSLYSPTLIPQKLTLENYTKLLSSQFPLWVRNSLILGGVSAAVSVMLATFAGYAFSRLNFAGRRYGILILLIIQMLPTVGSLVAIFRGFQMLRLLNTLTGLILLFGFGGSALAVWLMKNFMDSIPRELDEAASIDGASNWQIFWRILFPLLQPMLVAQFIFGFIGVYNEYIVTTVFLSDTKLYPLGVGVRLFSTQFNTNWTQFCAAAVLGSLPIMLIFFLAQRFLVEGLTKGALKG
ncbi:MAG TPA: sugar ABC transporter permease [Kouleothrix sp.]|uniref:sugar ABC transporter permease n=1 Tax=Kouleothrix sp. TaxID=2779161 RepID=UPI002BCB8E51|nr:sugar ABC transporter permease [Kouleothrix sp.]HRC76126.1 sugar ABC transporter permease [Kouleothrix sp.]